MKKIMFWVIFCIAFSRIYAQEIPKVFLQVEGSYSTEIRETVLSERKLRPVNFCWVDDSTKADWRIIISARIGTYSNGNFCINGQNGSYQQNTHLTPLILNVKALSRDSEIEPIGNVSVLYYGGIQRQYRINDVSWGSNQNAYIELAELHSLLRYWQFPESSENLKKLPSLPDTIWLGKIVFNNCKEWIACKKKWYIYLPGKRKVAIVEIVEVVQEEYKIKVVYTKRLQPFNSLDGYYIGPVQ